MKDTGIIWMRAICSAVISRKRAIERFRPQEKRAMQQHAIDLALENAGVDQAEKRLEQHFADAVEALFERSGFAAPRALVAGASRFMIAAKLRVVAMADDQALRQRVADLADADLQRAAVAHEARGMKADGVFGVGDRLGRRREQRKIGRGTVEHRAEFVGRQIARRPA